MPKNNLRIIITGATGMVGEGILHECLQHRHVAEVLVVNRKPCGVSHPKLKELLHKDFFDLSPIASQLKGYDACLFCLGVSSVGMKEPEYYRLTYTLTMHMATTLFQQSAGLCFCYISGAGTDSSEKGRSMWAKVKGKTENDLLKIGFAGVYNFRPGIISPTKGLKNTLGFYKWLGWLIPVIYAVAPNFISSLQELGLAMVRVVNSGYEKHIIEVKDIHELAKK